MEQNPDDTQQKTLSDYDDEEDHVEIGGEESKEDLLYEDDPIQRIKKEFYQIRIDKQKAIRQLKTIADEYNIQHEPLGEGGFGKVYRGTHKETGIVRAIKQIRKKPLDQNNQKQLLGEIEHMKNLDHPNLVKLIEHFEDEKYIYLVQEYLGGLQLFEQLAQMDGFDEDFARKIMKQALSAINYIHQQNVSHRDIKPENFVFESPTSENIKLIDFGFSSSFMSLNETQNKPLLLRMRTPVGTAIYAAPEVYQREYTEKCDIWSAGIMLYVFLCGYPPFNSKTNNEIEIRDKILKGNVKFGQSWDNISDQAKDLVCKLLVPEKDRLTAKECLEHPWFEVNSSMQSSCALSQLTIDRLKNYAKSVLFRQCVQYLMAYRCNLDQDIEKFRKVFFKIDKEQQGYLTMNHAYGYFKEYFSTEGDFIQFFNTMDLDKNGKVHWNEFLSSIISSKIINREENLKEVYFFFDRNKRGFFDSEDFKVAISDPFLTYKHANYDNVITEAFYGKEQITYEDFKLFMLSTDDTM